MMLRIWKAALLAPTASASASIAVKATRLPGGFSPRLKFLSRVFTHPHYFAQAGRAAALARRGRR